VPVLRPEKDASEGHGLQKRALTSLRYIDKKLVHAETLPGVAQHGQAAVVQRTGQFDLVDRHAGLAAQSSSD
jgi:hypothetical protein